MGIGQAVTGAIATIWNCNSVFLWRGKGIYFRCATNVIWDMDNLKISDEDCYTLHEFK